MNYLLDTNKLTLVLCGKHTLIDTLCLDKHQDFYARIRRRYYMPLFNDKETSDYIDFQLSTAKSNIAFADDVKELAKNPEANYLEFPSQYGDLLEVAYVLRHNAYLDKFYIDNKAIPAIVRRFNESRETIRGNVYAKNRQGKVVMSSNDLGILEKVIHVLAANELKDYIATDWDTSDVKVINYAKQKLQG